MRKKLVSLALALALCLGLTVPAFAEGDLGKAGGYRQTVCRGFYTSWAIKEDNSLWGWGEKQYLPIPGFAGDRWSDDQTTPVKIMDNVAAISAEVTSIATAVLVVKTDGTLWSWGGNLYGEVGDGTTEKRLTPIKIMDNVAMVSAGDDYCLAVKTDGTLWAWGNNYYGQLGNGRVGNTTVKAYFTVRGENGYYRPDVPCQTVPVKIMDGVSAVCAGWRYAAAVKTDGTLWTWGSNYCGKLGDGTMEDRFTPVKVLDGVTAVSTGQNHALAVRTDGSLWGWGRSGGGQIGNGGLGNAAVKASGISLTDSPLPDVPVQTEPVKVMDGVAAVSTGGDYSLIVGTNGVLWMCGYDSFDYLGTRALTPVKVMDSVAAASLEYDSAMVLKTDGTLWAWGNNLDGVLGCGDTEDRDTPVRIMGGVKLPAQYTINTPVPAPKTVGGFTDVRETDYFADAVLWAVEQNITSGTSKTTFSPGATCNRAQILSFLWRASGSPEPTISNPFMDIKSTDYFYKAALWAAEKGIVSGSAFGANTDCTRASTMDYMWKAAGSPVVSYDGKFDDVPASSDYAQAVAWALENGVTSGTSKTTFGPDSTCTRGQIVTFLYRAFGK